MTTLLTPAPPADTHPAMLAWFRRRGFDRAAVRVLSKLRTTDLHALADAVTGYGLGMYRDGLRDSGRR
jgi:hypothetical protein